MRLASKANSHDAASDRILTAIRRVVDDLSRVVLPDYETQEQAAREEYNQLVALVNRAGTAEERIALSNHLVSSLSALNDLSYREQAKEGLLKVVSEPTSPVEAQPRHSGERLVKGAGLGLLVGALAAYILYKREALFGVDPATSTAQTGA